MGILEDWKRRERGALPGPIEMGVMLYVFGKICWLFQFLLETN